MKLTSIPHSIRPSHLLKPQTPKPLSSSTQLLQPLSPKPLVKVPLFLKPPIHSTPLSNLKTFQNWAKELSNSLAPKFQNGPEPSLLCRELNWLLEDTVQEEIDFKTLGLLENDGIVSLRVEMEELYVLWKQRVEERRPFQYIVGCEHWRDLVLCVQEGVLIPRPETELIVDLVEGLVLDDEGLKEGVWADLGTGSGALAIGIGRVLGRNGRVVATDLSSAAASVAGFNVQRYGLQDKVEIRTGSWFEPLEDVKGKLVGLVSNPPYIPSGDIPGLQAEVVRHEPRLALDGGEEGMDDLIHLCKGAASFLKPGGFFIFETNGEKQSQFLVEFMNIQTEGCFQHVKVVSDFAGIQRFVTGFRK